MDVPFAAGDAVQTPLGKGVVRDVQNNGRLVIQIQQRTLVMPASTVSLLKASEAGSGACRGACRRPGLAAARTERGGPAWHAGGGGAGADR